jgi:hypothetical protein
VFFCFSRPAYDADASSREGTDVWTADAGDTKWYLYDLESEKILDDAAKIIKFVQCEPDASRRVRLDSDLLSEVLKSVEKHIAKTYLRKVQAPVGVKPSLKAWMELN